MRIRILGWAAAACLLAAPAASAEADDACVDAAAEVVREMEAGPAAPLSARERGLVIAASVRACRSADEADAATADEADAATATEPDPARGTVLLDGSEPREQGLRAHLERWLADPVECERVKRPNGRWVRICE